MTLTITISTSDYQKLRRLAQKHKVVREVLFSHGLKEPSTKNIASILKGFRASKRYSPKFLNSLELGLKESNYFKAGAKKTK